MFGSVCSDLREEDVSEMLSIFWKEENLEEDDDEEDMEMDIDEDGNIIEEEEDDDEVDWNKGVGNDFLWSYLVNS